MTYSELGRSTQTLNTLNQHDASPGQVMGLDRSWVLGEQQAEAAFLRESLPPHKALEDGSLYLSLDIVGLALLRELPPGSVIGIAQATKGLAHLNTQQASDAEVIAMIIENSPSATRFIGLMKKIVDEDGKPKRVQWNKEAGPTGETEKALAMSALRRMYDPAAGIEGSQMNSPFDITQPGLPADKSIRTYGCFSHNNPVAATSQNVMRGATTQVDKVITTQNPDMYIRVRPGIEYPGVVQGLEVPEVEESDLLFQGLIATAQRVASRNPSGMGAGTNPEKVFDRLIEESIALPEKAMNGMPIGVLQQQFIKSLR